MKFSALYGNGALMGFTPQQVQQMTLWEFMAAFTAWCRFNNIKSGSGEASVSIEHLEALGVE